MGIHLGRRGQLEVAAVVLAGAVGGLWWWHHRPPAPIVWQGYAEADYVKVAPTQAGELTALSVARGDQVAQGAPLFTQDDKDERAACDQAARQLDEATQQLANLESGGKLTEIRQAQANLADMQATQVRTHGDLVRGVALLRDSFATKQSVDQLSADNRSAEARVAANQAALAEIRAPLGRTREIGAQGATMRAARAALDIAQWRLAQRRVTAPVGGRIIDVLAQPGETMAAGMPVVSLLPPGNIFVRFFVPEPELASVRRGDSVALACDGCGVQLRGTVSFISSVAEYTPPVIYSEKSRAKLVFMVEARLAPEQAGRLSPGEPFEVRPGTTGGGPSASR